jgi:hypothetical protein
LHEQRWKYSREAFYINLQSGADDSCNVSLDSSEKKWGVNEEQNDEISK